MKKFIALLLAVACVFGLAACKEKPNPQITIELEDGRTIKCELYPKYAPNTVENMIYLAQSGYYEGKTFHRASPGFVIQGGSPNGDGIGGAGYSIEGEFAENGYKKNTLKHTRGVLSMARTSDPDSACCQFFICLADSPVVSLSLDGKYAGFGKVMDEASMQVVDEIAALKAVGEMIVDQPVIRKVTVETFGVKYDEPKTIS